MPCFDEFISAIESVLDVSTKEKRHVRDMLRKLQKDNGQHRQHGREMKAFCEADLDIEAFGEDEKLTSSICAMSIPFLSLTRTSANQVRSISAGSSEHPSRPLLQMHTRIVNEKRELAQAITQWAPQSHYLHVAGLWCVIVNHSTLVTCSKLSLAQLSKDISFVHDSNDQLLEHSINLRAGRTRSWLLPVRISTSLPSLLSMLVDRVSDLVGSNPEAVLKYRSRPIKFAGWRGLLESFSKSDLDLALHTSGSRRYGRSSKPQLMEFLKAGDPVFSGSEANHSNNEAQAEPEPEFVAPAQYMGIYSYSLEGSTGK